MAPTPAAVTMYLVWVENLRMRLSSSDCITVCSSGLLSTTPDLMGGLMSPQTVFEPKAPSAVEQLLLVVLDDGEEGAIASAAFPLMI